MADENKEAIDNEEIEDNREEESEDYREEETKDEIRDETYREDDTIEMLRSLKEEMARFGKRFDTIEDTMSMFVQSGATIREDIAETFEDDYKEDFVEIEDLDLSI